MNIDDVIVELQKVAYLPLGHDLFVVQRNMSYLTETTVLKNLDFFDCDAVRHAFLFTFVLSLNNAAGWSFPRFLRLQLFFVNIKAMKKGFIFNWECSFENTKLFKGRCAFERCQKGFLYSIIEVRFDFGAKNFIFFRFSLKFRGPLKLFGYRFTRVNRTSALVLTLQRQGMVIESSAHFGPTSLDSYY